MLLYQGKNREAFEGDAVAVSYLLKVKRIQSTIYYYIDIDQHFQKYLL